MPSSLRELPDRSTWSRGGCRTCKRRRKKCDGAVPSCQTCQRLGIRCDGYASIWAEPLVGPSQVDKLQRMPQDYAGGVNPIAFRHGSKAVETPPLPLQDSIPPVLTFYSPMACERAPFYLQYHEQRISRSVIHVEREGNPLLRLLIPRALTDPLLHDVVCALSALHYYHNVSQSPKVIADALQCYDRAVRALRLMSNSLSSALDHGLEQNSIDTFLLAVTWLCNYEIVASGTGQWRSHLDALQSLLARSDICLFASVDVLGFVNNFNAYAQSMALLTSQRRNSSAAVLESAIATPAFDKMDDYFGCSGEMVQICKRIAILESSETKSHMPGQEVLSICSRLSYLGSLKESSHAGCNGVSPEPQERSEVVADLYYYAAILYLYLALSKGVNKSDISANEHLPMLISRTSALSSFCAILAARCLTDNCEYSALVFPLFIAGCAAQTFTERALIMSALKQLHSEFGVGNVAAAIAVVERVWESAGAESWEEVLSGWGWDLVLA